MKRIILVIFFFQVISNAWALGTKDTGIKIPIQRQVFHDKINEIQKILDVLDGKLDSVVSVGVNADINLQVSDALIRRVDILQDSIELCKKINTNNEKVRYLIYLDNILRQFYIDWRTNKFDPLYAPLLIESFEKIMQSNIDSVSMESLITTLPYNVANLLVSKLDTNVLGFNECKNIVYLKFCKIYPEKILQYIAPFTNQSFTDSLVNETCKNDPTQVYNFVQNKNSVTSQFIRKSTNPVVKTVVQISSLPFALLYFPFLDDIILGKKNMDTLKQIIGDANTPTDTIAYYKLLVQTEIDYSKRMNKGDTPIAYLGHSGLREMLKVKDSAYFIHWINELHEQPENIRMRAIEKLSPIDIYYMIVMGESDIYTSSYKHSFNRMLQRMGNKPNTDSLLVAVNYDYFKKFIKMAANFNKLDTFLNLMPAPSAEKVMQDFVANLEKTSTLEDAVDVADSYSSINNKKLQANILHYVIINEHRCSNTINVRGQIIYNVLKTIFLSADSTNKVDLAKAIGIPPIYTVDNKSLMDDSGRIVQQVYFYGDDDGKKYFPEFINSFSVKDWRKNESNTEWVEIKSIATPQILIYVNRPLSSDANLDDTAQVHLNNYLRKKGLTPSIITHRGHSYWLPGTMNRMAGNAKIVVLGSCGGYKNLNQLININPDAHIISTKEIGTGNINQIITNNLNEILLSGKIIFWKNMWDNLSKYFLKQPKDIREYWDDYIPPYKNLGAIFIKAYNKKIATE